MYCEDEPRVPPFPPRECPTLARAAHMFFQLSLVITFAMVGCEAQRPTTTPVVKPTTAVVAEPSRDKVIEQAIAHQEAGQVAKACELFRNLLLSHPQDYEVLFHLANAEVSRGNQSLAIELLSEIPSEHPEAGLPALGVAADWCLQSERYDEAEARYRKILELNPSINIARRSLAYLLNRQGRRHEAVALVRELCLAGDVMQDELHSLIVEADAMYDPPEQIAGPDSRPYWPIGELGIARQLYTENRYQEAAQHLRPLIESGTAPPAAIAFYGAIVAEAQDEPQFDWWLNRVDESVKTYPDYWAAIGTFLMREAKYDQALRALAEAVRLDPTDFRSTRRIVQAYRSLDQAESTALWVDRFGLMNRILKSSIAIADAPAPPINSVNDLSQDLDTVGRHLEAILWRSLAATSQPNAAQQQRELGDRHRTVIASGRAFPTLDERWCGINIAELPLPIVVPRTKPDAVAASDAQPNLTFPRQSEPVVLKDVTQLIGLSHAYRPATQTQTNGFAIYQSFGGGVAVLDFDLNGQLDLYLAQGAADAPEFVAVDSDILYRTIVAGDDRQLDNVTGQAGLSEQDYTIGATSGDWNQDGFPDLAISGIGLNRLLINQGDGTFQRHSLDAVADFQRGSTSLAMADVTGDQLPDLYVLNYLRDPQIAKRPRLDAAGIPLETISPLSVKPARDQLYVNMPTGTWQVAEVGDLPADACTGLGIVVTDLLPDHVGSELFIGNDELRNQLWVRNQDQGFVDLATALGCAYGSLGAATGSMGIAAGDFDRSGSIDLHVANYLNESVSLFLSRDGFFRDLNVRYDLARTSTPLVGFGSQGIDATNRGWLDLVVTNGHVEQLESRGEPFRQPPQWFANLGDRFEIVNVPKCEYWQKPHLGRALARLDFNRDGQMDLIITDLVDPTTLLINESPTTNHWVSFRLVGTSSERDAIGAKVQLEAGQQRWSAWVTAGDGYLCKNESVVHFGIGNEASIQRAIVTWPDGRRQTYDNVPVDNALLMTEGEPQLFVFTK